MISECVPIFSVVLDIHILLEPAPTHTGDSGGYAPAWLAWCKEVDDRSKREVCATTDNAVSTKVEGVCRFAVIVVRHS